MSAASLYRWRRRQDDRAGLIPGRAVEPRADPALRTQVAAAHDATLAEPCAQWATSQGDVVSVVAMRRSSNARLSRRDQQPYQIRAHPWPLGQRLVAACRA